jgi:hypothetical protein
VIEIEHDYFMHQALDKARSGIVRGQAPFGACVVYQGEVFYILLVSHVLCVLLRAIGYVLHVSSMELQLRMQPKQDLMNCIFLHEICNVWAIV